METTNLPMGEMKELALTAEEQKKLAQLIRAKYPYIDVDQLVFETDGTHIYFRQQGPKRILAKMGGVYIGDPDTWNDAKRAEYYDTLPNPLE